MMGEEEIEESQPHFILMIDSAFFNVVFNDTPATENEKQ